MKDKLKVDLNCDLGESFGPWKMGDDAAILPYISSVNIACGFHAGDPSTMLNTIELAQKYDVHIGAHPGFYDREGFGRREIKMSPSEVYALVIYQVGALQACATAKGAVLHHVKPHGALYNMAAKEASLAAAIVQAVVDVDPSLILYGLSGSALVAESEKKGLRVYHEVFADRTYQPDGSLTPRTASDAVIKNSDQAIEQVLHMLLEGKVTSVTGTAVTMQADTICLHGDNPAAVTFAATIAQALNDHDIRIR
ncbi:5-oxoprolinase subunit PxpA [Sphingobacterium oryzagri]|uniref:5-oxoprolinase subunit A n=1 Tax=Sphingobacterium oryzagri TaxID=3025669 RepID=A0ABY7WN66_9SPHI|nr:5-oxoprolinase subunit PxpA [Sphingobacterium sp. KACC 22765]WDF69853.1 5-oxoprolinase subunit PxpA [Sphingobacterium sp. KACC 22765]